MPTTATHLMSLALLKHLKIPRRIARYAVVIDGIYTGWYDLTTLLTFTRDPREVIGVASLEPGQSFDAIDGGGVAIERLADLVEEDCP